MSGQMDDQVTTPERGRQRDILTGAQVLSGQLGKTIQRLRKAYNLSLSELAEQSGVAKSIISQIERNETNPTLATIWRLSQALDVSIERVLATSDEEPFIEKTSRADTPILVSDDGKVRLAIIGWIKTVAGLRRTKLRGLQKVDWSFTFAAAAYNLIRLPKLLGATA